MSLQTVSGERVDSEREKRFLTAHAAGHDRIYRYFRRRTDDAATAEDLCAEVFRIAWEKSGQGGVLSVMVLFGVAKNVLRNHDRSLSRSAGLFGALRLERATEVPANDSAVRDALNLLSTDDREVLLLTYWDGLTSSEVSGLLNTTSTAVRMRLHRARKELSRVLQEHAISEGVTE
ncbi:RNA polymerase sigma factor [Arthrobacter sp. ISL-69]|uniref:RNA polymerase sigma factor n=1 Tax=Arthrobacter sp. ISL-69 TaxID=2819113 RepID=UPI001BEA6F3F|nr:RNA polymerase sigma factor [Arthrobacter sp. ISL-69]MBT2538788.1 RNA polymerase sigma factor [Arthrobacter sp. ISL-69]